MLYTWNLYSVVCQLCLNKTKKKNLSRTKVYFRLEKVYFCVEQKYAFQNKKYTLLSMKKMTHLHIPK